MYKNRLAPITHHQQTVVENPTISQEKPKQTLPPSQQNKNEIKQGKIQYELVVK
jgi:hypothetical protein